MRNSRWHLLFFVALCTFFFVIELPFVAIAETTKINIIGKEKDPKETENGLDLSASEHSNVLPVSVPILMYHHISENPQNSAMVTEHKFRTDMEYLKEKGYHTVFFEDLYEYLLGYGKLPEKPIIITFDDGYQSNYDFGFPIMKELEMKFTISIIGWSMGRSTFPDSDKPITPHFNWTEAQEMYDSGLVDFQNHTYDLHSPKGESYGAKLPVEKGVLPLVGETYYDYKLRFSKDLLKLAIEMYEKIGRMPNIMCYPYGYNVLESERVLKTLGYIGSLKTTPGIRSYAEISDLWEMPRINVDNATQLEALLLQYENEE